MSVKGVRGFVVWAACAGLIPVPGGAPQAWAQKGDEAQLKAMVEGAKEVKKLSKPFSAEAQARIEKAMGKKFDKTELPPKLYAIAAGREACTACVATAAGPKGAVRLAVVVGKDHRGLQSIQKVGILSHKEDKAIEGEEFLLQFAERTATANAYNAPSVLEETSKKDDPEIRRLLDFLHQMYRNHELHDSLVNGKVPKKDATAVDEAKELTSLFDRLRGQGGEFGTLLKSGESAQFERLAREGHEAAKRGEAALAKKDFVAAQSAYDDIACNKCHGSFRKAFKDRRQALQIGDGYFQVGHDVLPAKKGADAASQAVAAGVRKALLILDSILQ